MTGNDFNSRLYVGQLSSQTTARDLKETFGKYGRVRRVDLKIQVYAFVDFSSNQEASYAMKRLNGVELNHKPMLVEFAATRPDVCCNCCGKYGHVTFDCKGCYICGKRGHIAKDCMETRKDIRLERRSPSPTLGPSYSRRRRSHSRSRTPQKRDLRADHKSSYHSRVPSHSGVRKRHSRSRTPPIRDLKPEHDQGMLGDRIVQWKGRCYSCGKHGHQARVCQHNQCTRCGEMGHVKKDCKM